MCDLERAKSLLHSGGYTCVLCKDEMSYHSKMRGVKPLLDFLNSKSSFKDFSAADRVVGAGAAHLYVCLGVKAVFAKVISERAEKILLENGISTFCENKVPYIINRAGDGMCPIEMCVKDIKDSSIVLNKIKEKLQSLAEN